MTETMKLVPAQLLVEADLDEFIFVDNYEETVFKAKMARAKVKRLVEQIAAARKEEKNARGEVRKDRQKFKNLMKRLYQRKVRKHPRDPSHVLNFLTESKPWERIPKEVGVSVQ